MASKQMLVIYAAVVLAITVLPAITLAAKTFMVGDDSGWTTGFDYQAWTNGKEFKTGDKLVFKYPEGAHNVQKVNGTGFADCIKPAKNLALTTGNDVVTLATPGMKWYICGVGHHCDGGQKFSITVTGKALDSTNSAHNGIAMSWVQVVIIAAVVVATSIMVMA